MKDDQEMRAGNQLRGALFTEMETEAQEGVRSTTVAHRESMHVLPLVLSRERGMLTPAQRSACSPPARESTGAGSLCRRPLHRPRCSLSPADPEEKKQKPRRRQETQQGESSKSQRPPHCQATSLSLSFPSCSQHQQRGHRRPLPMALCVASITCVGKMRSLQPRGGSWSFRAHASASLLGSAD